MTTTPLNQPSLVVAPKLAADARTRAPQKISAAPAIGTPEFLALPTADRLLIYVDRLRYWLLGFTLLALCAGFNGQWRPEPDSALYLTIGRSLATGHGYSYMGTHN